LIGDVPVRAFHIVRLRLRHHCWSVSHRDRRVETFPGRMPRVHLGMGWAIG
jgi:hypothetical protein